MAFSNGIADFRSDTVTQPTDEMRRAMAAAEVGDDVYSDDPTTNRFEEEAANAIGFESAVFVPSGIMANQLPVMAQTRPGEEVICDPLAHLRNIEHGASSALSQVAYRPVDSEAGRILPEHIDDVMELAGRSFPRVRLACWENTHNLSGGRVVPADVMAAGFGAAKRHGLAIHVDGARIWNAAIALGVPAAQLVAGADTVSYCLSKGLGAPVGSVVVGSRELMAEVRYLRRRVGGGMRQVGILAAAASIALRDRERLVEDHRLATLLATLIAERRPELVDLDTVESNLVNCDAHALPRPFEEIRSDLHAAGIRVLAPFKRRFRLVTHRDVDQDDVRRLVDIVTA